MHIDPIPYQTLIHSVTYEEKLSGNSWSAGNEFDSPVTINHVLVQPSSQFAVNNREELDQSSTVLFFDSTYSSPLVNFVKGSKITFNNQEMYVSKVDELYAFDPDIPHHIEVQMK